MEDLKIRLELEPNVLGIDRLTHLEISVSHDKGGIAWGTGEYHKTGVRCDISPLEIRNFDGWPVIGRIYDGNMAHMGFFTHLIDCKKKSPKKMQMAFEKIKPHAEEIKDLFIKGKYNDIANLLVRSINE